MEFFRIHKDIPFMRHSSSALARTLVGGWEVSGIVTIESGLPLNVTISGPQGGNGLPSAQNRPDKAGSLVAPHTKGTVNAHLSTWYDSSAGVSTSDSST